jgi:hypothetical protein
LIKKIYIKFSTVIFLKLIGHQNPGSGTVSGSALGSGSVIRKNSVSVSALNQCGSTTLLKSIASSLYAECNRRLEEERKKREAKDQRDKEEAQAQNPQCHPVFFLFFREKS